ncbi:hypothetical protein BY458DRAFT_584502 [Sporodiniella umbellata]|nr:hypothetical protein BY458DRAFT_584502 [Sporodiniella umbellata]
MYGNGMYIIQSNLSKHNLVCGKYEMGSRRLLISNKSKSVLKSKSRAMNLSWRQWYRNFILQKKHKPNSIQNAEPVKPKPLKQRAKATLDEKEVSSNDIIMDTLRKNKVAIPTLKRSTTSKFYIEQPTVECEPSQPMQTISTLIEDLDFNSPQERSSLRRCKSRYNDLSHYFSTA